MNGWLQELCDARTVALLIVSALLVWRCWRGRVVPVPAVQLDSLHSFDLLDTLYAGLGDACLLLTPEGEILYANEGASDLFATGSGLQGRRLSQLLPDPRVPLLLERSLTLPVGAAVEDEFTITVLPRGRAEEHYFVFNAAVVNLPDQPGRLVRLVVRDESRRQETEQIRRDFVANASHELRTPLAIINGYLENLVEGDITDPTVVQHSLTVMKNHGERLERLVEDMLNISRYEAMDTAAHRAQLLAKRFHCRECVQEVVTRLRGMIEARQARVVLEIPAADELAGDSFYWEQIFTNLIENSLKENVGMVGLVIAVSFARTGSQVEIRVRDNGKGIPHEHLPFIFKRFYRVATDHSQQAVKGTGLGLSIVTRAVEAHGGNIRVESSPSFRTEFIIVLPAA